MGAMKDLLIDAQTSLWDISTNLEKAAEIGDLEIMKQALRSAIVHSALGIAYIQELENI